MMTRYRQAHRESRAVVSTATWLLAALLGAGCDLGGYPDLASRLDTLEAIGQEDATAWMRTAVDGHSDILVLGGPAASASRGFVLITMHTNSTGTILAGTAAVTEERIVLSVTSTYEKKSELDEPPASRQGSTREDHQPPRKIVYEAEPKDGRLHLTQGGAPTMVMTDLWDVISTIDVTSQSGVEMLARVFNLSTVSLQMRIPGFGGAGLMQYAREPSEFVGVIRGKGTIEMKEVLNPLAEILFIDYQDYPGIVLNGDQLSKTDMGGNGNLSGTMRFSMVDPRGGGTFDIQGELTYQLTLTNGTSSEGGYTVVLSNGTTWTVPYKSAENMDFREILPPS
jgi:hypothetical protein